MPEYPNSFDEHHSAFIMLSGRSQSKVFGKERRIKAYNRVNYLLIIFEKSIRKFSKNGREKEDYSL